MKQLNLDDIILRESKLASDYNEDSTTLKHVGDIEGSIQMSNMSDYHKMIADSLTKLKQYEMEEKENLFVKLPCKIGDTVWCIFERKIYEGIVEKFTYHHSSYYEDYINIDVTYFIQDPFYPDGRLMRRCDPKRYGERVFLTREEAEMKLAELTGN